MKLAISLPDDLARQVDACAKRLRVPRSRLLAEGARLIVAKHQTSDATTAWNAAIDASRSFDDKATAELRRRSKRAVRKAAGKL